jgi:hypothetical protein
MGKTNELLDGVNEDTPPSPEEAKDGQDFLNGLDLPLDKGADESDPEAKPKAKPKTDDSDPDSESPDADEDNTDEGEAPKPKEGEDQDIDLDQDLPEEEVGKLSKREQGLYRALKQEREKRQETEKERDFLKLKKKFGKDEEKPEDEQDQGGEADEEDPLDSILKGKEDDDFLTAGEMKKLREASKAKAAKEAQKRQKEEARQSEARREHEEHVDKLEVEFKKSHPDYPQALGHAAEMIQKYPGLALELKAESDKGTKGNPVAKVYEIAKLNPNFGKKAPAPTVKKSQTTVEKMISNAEKQGTSAGVSGGSSGKEADLDSLKSMEDEELARTVANMSEAQFFKLPRSIRERALRAAD